MSEQIDYKSLVAQKNIIKHGSREQVIRWLQWNDKNGIYSDEESENEGLEPLSDYEARELMRGFVEGPVIPRPNPENIVNKIKRLFNL